MSGDGMHSSPGIGFESRRGRVIAGWLTGSMQQTLSMLIDRYQVESVIEVGSFLGLSATWFAERGLDVTCVDLFGWQISDRIRRAMGGAEGDHYDLFLANTEPYPNITSHKMPSLEAAALDLQADLVYIDAGHEYEDVKADVEAWTPHALKVICGDDNTDQWPGVQQYAREIGANVDQRIWWKPV